MVLLVISLLWVAFFGGIWVLIRRSRRSTSEVQALHDEVRQLRADVQRLGGGDRRL